MNRKRNRLFITITISVMLLSLLAGCAGNADSNTANPSSNGSVEQKLEKIRYAPLSGVSGLAVSFGAEKGFFKEEGLDVEFISTKDPIAGLTSKDIDVVDVATTTAIVAAGKGAPIKIVSSMFRTKGPFYLITSPGIDRVEDLKGKKVGVAVFGSGLEVYTRVILEKHGINADDVTLVANSTHQAAYASLETGQVDATIIHEPFASLVEKEGKGKIIATGWDYLPTFHTGVLAARQGILQDQPELVEKLIRAYFKSQEYAKSHPEEFKEYYLKNIDIDPDVLDQSLKREDVLWENNPDVNVDALKDTQKIQKELGFQDEIYDVESILDLRFIPQK
ncbi:NitT/TauT family transport system substrate-binding protein [Paenibacillus uliginis N3/975]|uniref:NitT/TauT family transport system substrate-binding protein n=1 Tax=Paenibacillus uliginis N3/975 TaxID=1313296 RepID=A0A1X7H5U6_9BACL|nr:ABC transporter substrate-binding protein [Paenibacillus uliginis]SMF79633.1 NitT/TauT family transport system substrate-binding protein [Paenibacillus uliginis N3/975]